MRAFTSVTSKLERQDLEIIKNQSTKCFLEISKIFRITFECLNALKNSHMGKLEDVLRLGLRAKISVSVKETVQAKMKS